MKAHHPHNRAERLALKQKKDKLNGKSKGRPVKKTEEAEGEFDELQRYFLEEEGKDSNYRS